MYPHGHPQQTQHPTGQPVGATQPRPLIVSGVDYDKAHAWKMLCEKYFQRSLDDFHPDHPVPIPIGLLKQMSDDSHEYGRIRERRIRK